MLERSGKRRASHNHRAALVSGAVGNRLARLNLASRKFCSGFQKYVVPNTCLVLGTVRRCAIRTGGGRPAGGPQRHLQGCLWGRRRRVRAGRARALLLAPLHLAGGTPSVWAEAAALQQTQHYFSFSFSFCSFVHLNVYLELHFVKNLPLLFLFPS